MPDLDRISFDLKRDDSVSVLIESIAKGTICGLEAAAIDLAEFVVTVTASGRRTRIDVDGALLARVEGV